MNEKFNKKLKSAQMIITYDIAIVYSELVVMMMVLIFVEFISIDIFYIFSVFGRYDFTSTNFLV